MGAETRGITSVISKYQLWIFFISCSIVSITGFVLQTNLIGLGDLNLVSGLIPLSVLDRLSLLSVLITLIGNIFPALIAILLVLVLEGRDGIRDLIKGLLRWKIGGKWYVFIVLVPVFIETLMATLYLAGILWINSNVNNALFFPVLPWEMPLRADTLLAIITLVTGAAIGFYGYALPQLLKKYHPFVSGLMFAIGMALCSTIFARYAYALISHASLLTSFSTLTLLLISILPYAITILTLALIFTWLYDNTEKSLLAVFIYLLIGEVASFLAQYMVFNLGTFPASQAGYQYTILSYVKCLVYLAVTMTIFALNQRYFSEKILVIQKEPNAVLSS